MNVKAQGLFNAAKYVEEAFGSEALANILRRCSEPVRHTYTSAIPIQWHPMNELTEFVDIAVDLLGEQHPRIAFEVGAAGARANMRGVRVRFGVYLGKPQDIMKRMVGLWRQFNDEGSMTLLNMDQISVAVDIVGIAEPNGTFCTILLGWFYETGMALGLRRPVAEHIECRARGDNRCVFQLRGSSMSDPVPSIPPPPIPESD